MKSTFSILQNMLFLPGSKIIVIWLSISQNSTIFDNIYIIFNVQVIALIVNRFTQSPHCDAVYLYQRCSIRSTTRNPLKIKRAFMIYLCMNFRKLQQIFDLLPLVFFEPIFAFSSHFQAQF